MNYYQNRKPAYQNNSGGQGALRKYTCYSCNQSFETRAKAPNCRQCNKVLKGKYISK